MSAHAQLVEEQCPTAVVLACSDSRCPPELVFDQGLGDLFVVRWARMVIMLCVESSLWEVCRCVVHSPPTWGSRARIRHAEVSCST